MLNMKHLIDNYIDAHANAWTAATQRSERFRLYAVADALDGSPEKLWEAAQALAPSSRATLVVRASAFWQWLIDEGHVSGSNKYAAWRRKNRRLFVNAYKRRRVGMTYDEAKARIEAIGDEAVRLRALRILGSGCRWSESCQEKEIVEGKGGKVRRLYYPGGVAGDGFDRSYSTFIRRLKALTGLRPHDLRALAATRAGERGARAADLMEIFGWSDIKTAAFYLQPQREEELKQIMESA